MLRGVIYGLLSGWLNNDCLAKVKGTVHCLQQLIILGLPNIKTCTACKQRTVPLITAFIALIYMHGHNWNVHTPLTGTLTK